jgi:hypothetical protein
VRLIGQDWVHEPPTIGEAQKMVEELGKLLHGVDLLERSDLRSQRQQFDSSYALAFARYREIKAAGTARAFLTRVDPLTRLTFVERQFWTAAEQCAQTDLLDTLGLFTTAADALDEIVSRLLACEARGTQTWQTMSREYWATAPGAAGDLQDSPRDADLERLVSRFRTLQEHEDTLRQALRVLQAQRPPVAPDGAFDPRTHAAYLAHWPIDAPSSRRGWQLLLRVVKTVPFPTILRDSREQLPPWLQAFIDRGQLPPW